MARLTIVGGCQSVESFSGSSLFLLQNWRNVGIVLPRADD